MVFKVLVKANIYKQLKPQVEPVDAGRTFNKDEANER